MVSYAMPLKLLGQGMEAVSPANTEGQHEILKQIGSCMIASSFIFVCRCRDIIRKRPS